jgi:hypothetical protein
MKTYHMKEKNKTVYTIETNDSAKVQAMHLHAELLSRDTGKEHKVVEHVEEADEE